MMFSFPHAAIPRKTRKIIPPTYGMNLNRTSQPGWLTASKTFQVQIIWNIKKAINAMIVRMMPNGMIAMGRVASNRIGHQCIFAIFAERRGLPTRGIHGSQVGPTFVFLEIAM